MNVKPSIAVMGLAKLPAALEGAGFEVVTQQTDPKIVTQHIRELESQSGQALLILTPEPEATVEAWLSMQAVRPDRRILILGSGTAQFANSRRMGLPATVNEIMANFGAPPQPEPYGTAVVHPDGSVVGISEPQSVELDTDWGVFGGQPTPAAEPQFDDFVAPPAPVVIDDGFEPTPPKPRDFPSSRPGSDRLA